ncbi:MAG: hypothetical protein NDI94_06895 [Candidatus Woesearchaeota archaeon]|nr:hypothetical protein [Candidatus Woesearchaeota archaeon]
MNINNALTHNQVYEEMHNLAKELADYVVNSNAELLKGMEFLRLDAGIYGRGWCADFAADIRVGVNGFSAYRETAFSIDVPSFEEDGIADLTIDIRSPRVDSLFTTENAGLNRILAKYETRLNIQNVKLAKHYGTV